MAEKKVILEASLMTLGFAIQEAIKDGWEIDPDMPLTQVWTQYECGFVRVEQSEVKPNEAEPENDPPAKEDEKPEVAPVANDSEIPSSLLKISEPEPVVEVKPEVKKAGRPPKQQK